MAFKTQDNINNKNVIEEKPVLNNPEFLQSDLAEMVQKELEDSKMLQEKAMFKEVIRAKEGELYSTVHAQIITNIRMFSIFESVEKDSLLGNTGIFSLASYSYIDGA
jgi:hypothetical protein